MSITQQAKTTSKAAENLFSHIKAVLDGKVDSETGKTLCEEDFTAVLKAKLEAIEAGAQVNVSTDLSFSSDQSNVTVESSTGNSATLAAATPTSAGVMSGSDKEKLNSAVASADFTAIVKVTEATYPTSPDPNTLYVVV